MFNISMLIRQPLLTLTGAGRSSPPNSQPAICTSIEPRARTAPGQRLLTDTLTAQFSAATNRDPLNLLERTVTRRGPLYSSARCLCEGSTPKFFSTSNEHRHLV